MKKIKENKKNKSLYKKKKKKKKRIRAITIQLKHAKSPIVIQ